MLNYLYVLQALLTLNLIHAYPQITNPAAGSSISGGATFTVTWAESGEPPTIADLESYELYLYTGTNASPQQIKSIASGAYTTGNSITVAVPEALGETMTNAYFLGLVSTATSGVTITSFSDRFTLTGMDGVFSIAIKAALKQVSGVSGPGVVNKVAAPAVIDTDTPAKDAWEVPYNLQSGLTKYAPMQPIPPTAITATNTKPLWPTSSVDLANYIMPIPTQVTTITQSQTFSVSSHTNTAAPASQPSDPMQKFLNRWKD